MANREELGVIRAARTGDAACQLALGKLYLLGGAGLPKSLPTALHWLQRAARQDCAEAWLLIGAQIPFEVAAPAMPAVLDWYERACDAGLAQAGLVLAQLVLSRPDAALSPALQHKALAALEVAAQAGLPDAQWLLAQQGGGGTPAPAPEWLARAADGGVDEALHAILGRDWEQGAYAGFLQRALPRARALLQGAGRNSPPPEPREVLLLARCAQVLSAGAALDRAGEAEVRRLRECAAEGGNREAQLALGLWWARIDGAGARVPCGPAQVNFKRAIRWLTLAGEQGLAEAWFALARIYGKPEFSRRSVSEAQACLERAADMGHCAAQLECGMHAWRTRREGGDHDVHAAYWLMKAARQGSAEAEALLRKIVAHIAPMPWMPAAAAPVRPELALSQPLLTARLELARLFNLSRAEALLLDLNGADHGHCLVVDIRAVHGRSRRRLVLVRTAAERQALNRLARHFENIDCGLNGPEGNYRQRLYRLRTYWPELAADAVPARQFLAA